MCYPIWQKTKLLKVKNKAGRKVVVKWAKAAGVSASEAKAGGYQVRPVTKVTNLVTGESRNINGKWSNKKKVRIRK